MSGTIVACWSCGGPAESAAIFCPTCRAVQPPQQLDHFARLGLPRSHALAAADIDRGYFDRQRRLHPDRFAARTARERAIAQQQAAALNEAYETLREPLRRAAYLAALRGIEMPADGRTIADPDLLAEAMESREALMEAADAATVDRLAAAAAERMREGFAALHELFLHGDAGAIRKALLRLRYLEKFADEARARRTNLGAQGR